MRALKHSCVRCARNDGVSRGTAWVLLRTCEQLHAVFHSSSSNSSSVSSSSNSSSISSSSSNSSTPSYQTIARLLTTPRARGAIYGHSCSSNFGCWLDTHVLQGGQQSNNSCSGSCSKVHGGWCSLRARDSWILSGTHHGQDGRRSGL